MEQVPRLLPEIPLPEIKYIPGQGKHPEKFESMDVIKSITDLNKRSQQSYLYGWDLANHGFNWEAHEAWELTWNDWQKTSKKAKVVQGLIFMTASCLKMTSKQEKSSEKLAKKANILLFADLKTCKNLGFIPEKWLKSWDFTKPWPICTLMPTCF